MDRGVKVHSLLQCFFHSPVYVAQLYRPYFGHKTNHWRAYPAKQRVAQYRHATGHLQSKNDYTLGRVDLCANVIVRAFLQGLRRPEMSLVG